MKGQQVLFDNLFQKPTTKVERAQRPRNYYLPERNLALAYRYYYHIKLLRKRYEDCLVALEREFFITEPRLIVVLSENRDELERIIKESPSLRTLANRYPHFSWKTAQAV